MHVLQATILVPEGIEGQGQGRLVIGVQVDQGSEEVIPYKDEDDAIAIANDTPYCLAGYVSSESIEHARSVASKMRTGMVHINGAPLDAMAPFGGYKQSGNGREWGEYGMEEFLEIKSVYGYNSNK